MSSLLVGILVGVGFGMWVYSHLQRNTGGGNPKNSMTGAGIAGLLGFIVVYTLFHGIFHI